MGIVNKIKFAMTTGRKIGGKVRTIDIHKARRAEDILKRGTPKFAPHSANLKVGGFGGTSAAIKKKKSDATTARAMQAIFAYLLTGGKK